ncbi:hypothetical protein BXO88_15350 [Oribacterium sp. C9]|uniref:CapA family protein n=1 Tax=Oribacterium sp. C9 TaxID=1943579 RepID=UPI00098F4C8F|nr:CapA family protein [Oribacterium sp. C9]OON84823.1 hypothetical protein BXO88_15350 [Oribacterium sp. C9]
MKKEIKDASTEIRMRNWRNMVIVVFFCIDLIMFALPAYSRVAARGWEPSTKGPGIGMQTEDGTGMETAPVSETSAADLIICSHPHVVEPEGYITTALGNSGLVFWSCGNLISAQSKVPRILGGLADVTIIKDDSGTRISSWDFIPTVTHFSGMDVRVFLLKDYNDILASVNHANYKDGPLTTERLWNLWTSITGLGRKF